MHATFEQRAACRIVGQEVVALQQRKLGVNRPAYTVLAEQPLREPVAGHGPIGEVHHVGHSGSRGGLP